MGSPARDGSGGLRMNDDGRTRRDNVQMPAVGGPRDEIR